MSSPILTARGRLNALQRHRQADDPEVLTARRDLRAQLLAEHVRKIVAEAPPLTAEQRGQIAALLRGGGSRAAA